MPKLDRLFKARDEGRSAWWPNPAGSHADTVVNLLRAGSVRSVTLDAPHAEAVAPNVRGVAIRAILGGVVEPEQVDRLVKAGVSAFTIRLDTLKPEPFEAKWGRKEAWVHHLHGLLHACRRTLELGEVPGILVELGTENLDEVRDLARFADLVGAVSLFTAGPALPADLHASANASMDIIEGLRPQGVHLGTKPEHTAVVRNLLLGQSASASDEARVVEGSAIRLVACKADPRLWQTAIAHASAPAATSGSRKHVVPAFEEAIGWAKYRPFKKH